MLAHRLEYLLFVGISTVVRAIPERGALALGAGLGWLVGSVLRLRRSTVDENLMRAFPEASPEWRRQVARASYRHLGREGVALLRMQAMSPAEVRGRTEVVGLEMVRRPLTEGRGVLILTGHLGNWEIGGAATAACGIPLDVVARRQKNPLFNAHLVRVREKLGMRVIDRQGATRHVLRAMREPRAVALVADQNVRAGGLFVDFFGVPASTERGPALLAERTGADVVVAIVHRLPGRTAQYRLSFEPLESDELLESESPGSEPEESEPRESASPRADARTMDAAEPTVLTRAYLAALERGIRAAPDQYFWFHRRWKTRPDAGNSKEDVRAEEPVPSATVPDSPASEPSSPESGPGNPEALRGARAGPATDPGEPA